MEHLDPTLHECRIDIVLSAWIAALKFLLGDQASSAEWRVHQYHVKLASQGLHEGNSLFGIVRKKPPARTAAIDGIAYVHLKRANNLLLGPFKKCKIVNP